MEIPEKERQFFLQGVNSIAEWEAVLLLREMPDKAFDAHGLAARLYIGQAETETILGHLESRGIVKRFDSQPASYRYSPATTDLGKVIDNCADLYRKYLIPVTRIIHSEPGKSKQAFADAFRLRKY